MKSLLLVVVCLTLFTSAQSVASDNIPVQKVFKNWQVTCNNLNTCDIRNIDENLKVIFKRQAGPTGKLTLNIIVPATKKVPVLWFDDKPFVLSANMWHPSEEGGAVFLVADNLELIQRWVKAAKNAHMISPTQDLQNGSSLAGLNAALLFVEDRQGRINNQSALLKMGSVGIDKVPSVPVVAAPHPAVTNISPLIHSDALIDAVIAANSGLLKQEYCEINPENRQISSAQPLTENTALVMVNCGLGAYQSSSILFVTPRDKPAQAKRLILPLPVAPDKGEGTAMSINLFTEVDYSPKEGVLFQSARGRGMADCGDSAKWIFDGKEFQLVSYNSQPSCSGGEPGDWPSIVATPGYSD